MNKDKINQHKEFEDNIHKHYNRTALKIKEIVYGNNPTILRGGRPEYPVTPNECFKPTDNKKTSDEK